MNLKNTIPNQLTVLRILLTPLFIYFLVQKTASEQLTASLLFVAASLTDWYDGWYARKFGVISRIGQFLDPLADKILVTSALIVFSVLNYVMAWMVWIIVCRDLIVTSIRIYALHTGKPIITHTFAKWKTFFQMVTIFLILIFINYLNYFSPASFPYSPSYFDVIGISMIIVTSLTIISGLIYIYENFSTLLNMLKKLYPF